MGFRFFIEIFPDGLKDFQAVLGLGYRGWTGIDSEPFLQISSGSIVVLDGQVSLFPGVGLLVVLRPTSPFQNVGLERWKTKAKVALEFDPLEALLMRKVFFFSSFFPFFLKRKAYKYFVLLKEKYDADKNFQLETVFEPSALLAVSFMCTQAVV